MSTERRVLTYFGEFIIRGATAVSIMDLNFVYELPDSDMADDEIVEFFMRYANFSV